MKNFKNINLSLRLLIMLFVLLPTFAQAANVLLANKPLVDSTTSDVLPNLMFILDNSGSMGQDYTPDWAGSGNPILFNNAIYNTQFYNPNIRYTPAVNYAGTSFGTPPDLTKVRNDAFYTYSGSLNQGTTNLVNNADYFSFVAGEYCTTTALTTCVAAVAPTATYPYAAPIRWCNTSANANATSPATGTCQAVQVGSFTNLRTPLSTFTITFPGAATVSSIKINGMELMSGPINNNSANNVANAVTTAINNCNSSVTGTCTMFGHTASRSANVVTVTSPAGAPLTPITVTMTASPATISAVTSTRPGSLVYTNIISAVTSYTEPGKSVKNSGRGDCAGATCTYAEEMANYANWWTFYRTRMQGMKSAASLAFKGIDSRYRVGFITIANQSSNYLPIAKYDIGAGQQKQLWYTKLFSIVPSTSTPLRSALSIVGRIYAGKKPVGSSDPVEYACQQNFALLTTDGYWNSDSASDVKDVNGGTIGNLDGGTTARPLYEGPTASSGSLADTAKYYYDTDIRTSAFGNCTGALGQNVCGEGIGNEAILKQNMTTLTLGLGIDGTVLYSSDYKTQTVGDFANIKAGSKNWPIPVADTATAIDDLWHAAVNANGTYFSARNPQQLSDSLKKALSDIQSKIGAGSAASASSLQPTAGDNFNYVASYATVKWTGNLEARTVNLTTFETSEDAVWCAENVAGDACAAPASLVAELVSGSSVFYCKTTGSDATKCANLGGTLSGTDCKVEVATSCVGTMASKVSSSSDSRVIKFNAGGNLVDFTYGNLSSAQKAYFDNAFLSTNLSQWADLSSDSAGPPAVVGQRTKAVGSGIVNFLRGQQGYEDRASNPPEDRIFRYREATLGDVTESQPAFIAEPIFRYTDPGYDAFKTAQSSRAGIIYVGANDGMLHAFDASNGQEKWAYVPTPVIPKMWKLADRNYAVNHVNLVNGDPAIGEVCVAACTTTGASWKTVLVAGLSGGGRGYYALDITNPNSPALLWEYTSQNNSNLGYTFATPVITKLNDGTWVALLTSGYNNGTADNDGVTSNSPAGNGQGYLYVVNIATGAVISSIATGAGSPATPSGLGQLAAYADDASKNATATYVYSGDLLGNLWRFDINAGTVVKMATLVGPGNQAQPITTMPQLGLINKKRVVFVGTGKYLEVADLSNTDKQSLYAIKDDNLSSSLGNPRGSLTAQTITTAGSTRTASNNAVDFNTGLGWYVDLPDTGERVNIDPLLINGVLLAPSVVPASTSCSPGGYGWFNYFNYKTGGAPSTTGGVVSEKLNAPAVGFNLVYDSSGKPVVTVVEANNPTPHLLNNKAVAASGTAQQTLLRQGILPNTFGVRSIWRELINRSDQ